MVRSIVVCGILAVSPGFAGCIPCEDGCSGGAPPEPSVECIAPGDEAIEFLDSSASFTFEYGPQGGQHFYLSLALQGIEPGELVLLRFVTADESFDDIPYIEGSCSAEEAVEVKNLTFQLPTDDDYEGELTVAIGTCATEYCNWDVNGHVTDFEPREQATRHIVVAAP